MEFDRRQRIRTHLNIAPLIDVVFLLLIFFMLSSSFVTQPGIKISLPAASRQTVHFDEQISIFITENHQVFLNDLPVTIETLLEHLKIKLSTVSSKNILLKADKKVDLGITVTVMDIAKQAQVEGIVIATQQEVHDEE